MSATEPWVRQNGAIISSADVPNPESMPESSPGEAARIHAALDHPYFSNHPTQTASSGIGDVVIKPRERSKRNINAKRWVILGTIILVFVVIIGVVIWGIGRGGQNNAGNDISAMPEEQRQRAIRMSKQITAAMSNSRYAGQLDNKYEAQMNAVRKLGHLASGQSGADFKCIKLTDVVAQEGRKFNANERHYDYDADGNNLDE